MDSDEELRAAIKDVRERIERGELKPEDVVLPGEQAMIDRIDTELKEMQEVFDGLKARHDALMKQVRP